MTSRRLQTNWRPLVGWCGVAALAWQGIAHPILTWVWAWLGHAGTPPAPMPADLLFGIVAATIGMGTMRSVEKVKGVEPKV